MLSITFPDGRRKRVFRGIGPYKGSNTGKGEFFAGLPKILLFVAPGCHPWKAPCEEGDRALFANSKEKAMGILKRVKNLILKDAASIWLDTPL